tara:strand:+ start:442 stop:1362 length:921 start_codon:yes stop_codon:yes gene_type:complete
VSILNQKTIKNSFKIDGVGLHTGNPSKVKIIPSSPNTGIVFKRVDLKKNNFVIPNIYNVSNATFCTTISNEYNVKVSTIEHLMAALFIRGIDNVLIEIDNEEVPILDGSSKDFIEAIDKTGITVSEVPIKIIKIEKLISFKDGSKEISLEPSKVSLDIDFEIKYENDLIGNQKNLVKVYEDDLTDVYNSRTFCVFEDIEKLKKMNLARGGSLDNAIVVKDNQILNKEGLRNDKEFVNHKILDCIGDLYLSGYKMIGKLKCSQGGHKLTNQLLRKVFNDNKNFSIVEIKEKNIPHSYINRNFLKSIA